MEKVKIVIWLLAIIFVQNWACRTDNIWVRVYHQRDLEPMGSFDGNSIDDENKGILFLKGIWAKKSLEPKYAHGPVYQYPLSKNFQPPRLFQSPRLLERCGSFVWYILANMSASKAGEKSAQSKFQRVDN